MPHDLDSLDILRQNGIPFEAKIDKGIEQAVVRADQVRIDQLRTLGFRISSGIGTIRYLIYHGGNRCGYII